MEQDEVTGYDQTDHIGCTRRANAQKHMLASSHTSAIPSNAKKSTSKRVGLCLATFFNQGSCCYNDTQETNGVLYKHVWSFYFTAFPHTGLKCMYKKKDTTRNEETET